MIDDGTTVAISQMNASVSNAKTVFHCNLGSYSMM